MKNTIITQKHNFLLSVGLISFVEIFIGCIQLFASIILLQQQNSTYPLKLSSNEASWIVSILSLVSPFGLLFIGTLADKIGRRKALQVGYISIVLSWLILSFANTYESIFIGRAIQGIAYGMPGCVYSHVAEVCLTNQRPFVTSIINMLVGIGMIGLCGLAKLFFWRTIAAILCVSSSVVCVLLFLVPESPMWLRTKGRVQEAVAAEQWYGTNPIAKPAAHDGADNGDNGSADRRGGDGRWTVFARRSTWLPSLILIGFFLCQQLSGVYILLLYTANVLQSFRIKWDGITVIAFLCIARLCGNVAFWAMHGVKRKTLTVVSSLGMAVALIAIIALMRTSDSVFSSLASLVAFVMYLFFSMLGLQSLPWIMGSEMFPRAITGTMNGVVQTVASVIIFSVTKIYPMTVNNLGIEVVWSFFAFVCVLSAFYGKFILPETKGKSLDEIIMSFESHNKTLKC